MIKIKVSSSNLPRIDAFKKELLHKQFMTELAKHIQQVIRNRVKAGWGVSSDSDTDPERVEKKKLKPLSPEYIKRRKKRTLGEFATPKKSNLTLTGQMLNAIVWKIEGRKIELSFNDNRRTDGETNSDVAFWASKTRPFFNLTKAEWRIITAMIKRHINDLTRKYFG